jgi:hypothetical protein
VSRPKLSVPNQCSTLGGRSFSRMFWSLGSYGASTGANIATITISRNTASPIHDVLLVLNACSVALAKYANGDGAGARTSVVTGPTVLT